MRLSFLNTWGTRDQEKGQLYSQQSFIYFAFFYGLNPSEEKVSPGRGAQLVAIDVLFIGAAAAAKKMFSQLGIVKKKEYFVTNFMHTT